MIPLKMSREVDRRPNTTAWLALASVCLLWGTTYLGIRIALDAFPPFYLLAIRYSISGGILLLAAKLSGAHIPRGRDFWLTALFGLITIGCGTGTLTIAEQWVPTGLAALFVSMQPFWMVTIDWLLPQGRRPNGATLRGLAVGLTGVAVLIAPSALKEGWHGGEVTGFLLLQLGAAGWVAGALLQRRLATGAHPIVNGAINQIAIGVFIVPAMLFEHAPTHIGIRPIAGILYLVVFGSIVGYSSFSYAMHHLPPAVVSVYTYVNPVVAVFLGWLLNHEAFTANELIAMALIFAGVTLVKLSAPHDTPAPTLAAEVLPSGE